MGYKNYSKISDKNKNNKTNNKPVHVEQSGPDVEEQELIGAEVTGCERLYVREEPHPDAKPLCIVEQGTKLKAQDSGNDTFYKIETEDGIVGYCMKNYIKLG